MSQQHDAAITALIRAAANRVLTQHGVRSPAFAEERLRASEEACDDQEIAIWRGITIELTQLLRRRRV